MDLDKYLTYEPSIEAIKPTGTGTHFFNEGGQTIFRNNWNTNDPNSRYLLFQGVAEADNHNHFDHLSFIIHAENQMMASDSGYTRSAYGDAVRREWYRTAPAHNTVTLDGFWPVDMAQNVTPTSRYDIDTDFFDFQQKEARFIENENETTRGESRLHFPPDSESLGYFERAIAFPGQDYFVVIDNLRSKTSTPREFDLYLHGGRGIMSGTGNHRLWTYGNDVYGSAAKMATWIFSDGATFSNHEGEVSYVKDDYGMYDFVKASTHAEKTNFIQVLVPLEITKTLPQVTEFSDNHRVGGTVAMDGNLDTFVVQQGNQDVTLAELGTNGSFAYVRENGLVEHWSAREATALSYRGNFLFRSSHHITLALDQSDRDRYSGTISSEKENFTLSVRNPAGKVADQAIFNGQSVSFENKEGYVHLTGLYGKGDIAIIFIENGEQDKIPPGNIKDLRATDQTSDTVTLTWTAPGNDGDVGAADFYDIRYNTSPITDDNWDDSVKVANEPTPTIAGTSQSMNIEGLRSSTSYYFAMRAGDEFLNLSGLSNVVAIETDYAPDTTAPANIKDLKVEAVSSDSVNLTWTAPGDDGYFGTADSYEIRYSTQPITEESWDAATLINNPPTPEIVGSHQTVNVADLKAGRSYFFAIKTRDKASNISGLSNLAFISLPDPDDMKPLEISDLYASSHDGNVPENTIDGDLGTRWSANGDGEWIKYDLGSIQTLSHIKLAWHNGHTRQTFFSIEVSTDNVNWTPILTNGASSGHTSDFEAYELENIHGRYVKLIGHGNSSSTWNSLSETAIYGTVADGLDPVTVGNIRFLDRDGKEMTALANGDFVQIIAPLTNNQQESQQVLMFMGLYDKKGNLVEMSFINNEVRPWETEVLSTGFILPEKLTGYYVKVSFWDSFEELTELSNEIILEGTE
ncbi:discoidin domain-containing protein [Anaerobacillus sp. CMMVII]|uniref:discoidin domain-containing protein n=1 Tax=Anaerobacillus sp. CMMVII TaxID=2755588 RepID=UPI0021B794D6|nr:discoidin domain-containing protein [Anaerobacillus sp. CMMVII]